MEDIITASPQVTQLVQVSPDQLIDIGQRMKQAAMDTAYPGDSVTVQFTQSITFVYHPEKEFLKPVVTVGSIYTSQVTQ